MTAVVEGQNTLLSSQQTSLVIGAEPGGEGTPSGFGRRQHEWTDWTDVASVDVDEDLSERVCTSCGAEQIVPTESLIPTRLLPHRGAVAHRGEAA